MTLQAHALATIDASSECLIKLASVLGSAHVFRNRAQTVLELLSAILASVTLRAFADLFLRSVLTFVGQVVRVSVLGCDLFNTVPKLGSVDAQH